MIQELNANRALTTRGSACSTRLSPASTFKIPHALVALETGVVTAQSIEKPDGTRYEQQPKWNHEHTVISALRPSVLWVFRRIAPRRPRAGYGDGREFQGHPPAEWRLA